ncbi:coiled-coil domain-containing protein 27-like [Microcebus murinus]|uniref:coiled-coil domain-containing protein 27-like n=1 Tax=Microcebus murinus TaxID=30608 RepID=UPI003F6B1E7C
MLPKEARTSEQHSTMPSTMAKGLVVLQGLATRNTQYAELTLPRKQGPLSKPAQAISRYYGKKREPKDSAVSGGFESEMEGLRKAFLMRPNCPQLSTRATPVSNCGSSTQLDLSAEVRLSLGHCGCPPRNCF